MMSGIFAAILRVNGQANFTVAGVSMEPTLHSGDEITIRRCEKYAIGDILVFIYKTGELLVHRLLRQDDRYYCKGDNAFRLEDIDQEQIYGKVVLVNGVPASSWPTWKLKLSYDVNRIFFQCRYNVEQTKQHFLYRLYREFVLEDKGNGILFRKNRDIECTKNSKISFMMPDSCDSDVFFENKMEIDILNLLSNACTLTELLKKICLIYEIDPDDIRENVKKFLVEAIAKKFVEVI